uniref:Uncharacterized protein n=1 Tax=Alexandrium monilatum TaxID=311494 RepID=A0A7S4W6C5_9DINO
MPVDYSRFERIGDSDSDGSQGGLDLSKLLSGGEAAGSPPGSPRTESPRTSLQRSLAPPPAPPAEDGPSSAGTGGAAEQPPQPATLERFVELAEGAEPTRGDDVLELLAVARATTQSALADGKGEATCRLVRALAVGLAAEPKAAAFAREQAPELVADILAASSSGLVPHDECEAVLGLIAEKCRPREVYTFLVEALCGDDLVGLARVRGIRLMQATFLRMDETKRHLFLGSCLPVLLKKSCETCKSAESMASELDALHEFAVEFLPKDAGSSEVGPAKVAQSMIAAFLLKVALKALPLVAVVEGLELGGPDRVRAGAPASEPDSKRPRGSAGHGTESRVVQLRCSLSAGVLPSLNAIARAGVASSGKPLLALLEEMDVGDPTTDGGGDLEVSPLCLAAFVCLLEQHGCWRDLQPQVLPVGISAARRVNILMRSCLVLLANGEAAPGVVSFGGDDGSRGGTDARAKGPRWAHRGLALFAASIAPLVGTAAVQTPRAYTVLSGPLCRWYPARCLQAVLEALASTPDIEREVRGAIFRTVGSVFRAFAWPCRFDLYHSILSKCRVDSIIGAVVTMFKDDWWSRVRCLAESGEGMSEERGRLAKVFKATLSGDLQVVDGMDTLTAALNVARLVALAQPPVGPFVREALRKGGPGVDLDGMLAGVSKQIDFELGVLDQAPGKDGSLSGELEQAMEQALGRPEGGVNLQEMKRDRITMVAHLVARVRELLAGAAA